MKSTPPRSSKSKTTQFRKPPPSTGNSRNSAKPPLDEVLDIIGLMGETRLAEISLETPDLKLALRKQPAPPPSQATPVGIPISMPMPMPMPGQMAMAFPGMIPSPPPPGPVMPGSINENGKGENRPAAAKPEKAPPPVPQKSYHKILSPMAGTFYRAPSPNSPPYVNEGDVVTPGKTVCIVEAMKLMNEIKADKAGKIIKIHVTNAKPVEKGTILLEIDTETTA